MSKYKAGTKVKCLVGSKPTEVFGTICDDSFYFGFVNLKGRSLIKFDKPIKMTDDYLVSCTTLSNRQISKI